MRAQLDAHKPVAPARVHLLLAATTWTVVGSALALSGVRWELAARTSYTPWLIAIAAALGLLKAHFVLARIAARVINRIRQRGDDRCIGGFFSLRTWGLVAVMAASGAALRRGHLPRTVLGFIYIAVGTALFCASLRLWRAWRRCNLGTA